MTDERLFRRLDSVPSLQLRLLLLRFAVTRSYLHSLRTSPPSQTLALCHRVDPLVARSLARICGNGPEEPLPAATLKEALLPPALGGLGVPCLSESRVLAHVASVLATVQQWRRYVPDSDPLLASWACSPSLDALLASVQPTIQQASAAVNAQLVFPVSSQAAVVFTQTNKLQQRLQAFADINTISVLKEHALTTNSARAQFLSKTGRGARAFLQACPTDAGLRISNDDMVSSLRLWLRLPMLPVFDAPAGLVCFCKADVVLSEEHLLNCNGEAARDVRHNTMALVFQEMLQAAVQRPVLLEPRASTHATDHHRFDISVAAFDASSRNLKLDVTIRNPLARHMVVRASASPLAAANDAVKDKLVKYAKYLTPSDWFLPLALESFGAVHGNVFTLISTCARRVGNLPPDSSSFLAPSFSTYWLQRISCALVRENARLVQHVITSSLRHSGALADDLSPSLLPVLLSGAGEVSSE